MTFNSRTRRLGRTHVLAGGLLLLALIIPIQSADALVGIGVRFGRTIDFDRPEFEELGIESPNNMSLYGAHLSLGAIPLINAELAVEHSSGDQPATIEFGGQTFDDLQMKIRDIALFLNVKYEFSKTVLKPYVGGGVSLHLVSYELKGLPGSLPGDFPKVPDDDESVGGQVLVGIALRPTLSPLGVFGELRVSKFKSSGVDTQTTSIYLGATFGG